jgi:hypothetical protein
MKIKMSLEKAFSERRPLELEGSLAHPVNSYVNDTLN